MYTDVCVCVVSVSEDARISNIHYDEQIRILEFHIINKWEVS